MDSSTNIGVIGAGTMGRGIAQIAAAAGHHVWMADLDASVLDAAMDSLRKIYARLVEKGRVHRQEADEILGRIQCTTDLNKLAPCGLVLEAIVEKLPAPEGDTDAPAQALIFDAEYDPYRGAIMLVRMMNGTLKSGDKVRLMHTGADEKNYLERFLFRTPTSTASERGSLTIRALVKQV